jgi:hypothetical protein
MDAVSPSDVQELNLGTAQLRFINLSPYVNLLQLRCVSRFCLGAPGRLHVLSCRVECAAVVAAPVSAWIFPAFPPRLPFASFSRFSSHAILQPSWQPPDRAVISAGRPAAWAAVSHAA